MSFYSQDYSLFDFNFSESVFESPYSQLYNVPAASSLSSSSSDSITAVDGSKPKVQVKAPSPPRHRHDGASPLPLGMDWSLPPHKWDGRDTIWPHDPQTGWSYCVTVPSWIFLPKPEGLDPVVETQLLRNISKSPPLKSYYLPVAGLTHRITNSCYKRFYRVQVGIQSPEGITTTRAILRRFSDFLKLYADLKKEFPKKNLPPTPPRRLLRMKSRTTPEERRCALEDWVEKLLSDIDLSRSVLVAIFLELEAAARSSFQDNDQQCQEDSTSFSGMGFTYQFQSTSVGPALAGSSVASEYYDDSVYETSELGTPRRGRDNYSEQAVKSFTVDQDIDNSVGTNQEPASQTTSLNMLGVDRLTDVEIQNQIIHARRLSIDSTGSELSSVKASEISNSRMMNSAGDGLHDLQENVPGILENFTNAGLELPRNLVVALPSDDQSKFNRVLLTLQRRIVTAKTDMEDLIARLNQEIAVRQYLTTKVKDLEVELDITIQNGKESMQQAVLNEREKFILTQWDVEELRRRCLENELRLQQAQDELLHMESMKGSLTRENEKLTKELDIVREQLENVRKHNEEFELKSKADVKLLVKEIKALRSSQSELKQDLSWLMKDKLEFERLLQKEKQTKEFAGAANEKLLHECEILRNRLQECSVNFLVEEEDKLIVEDTSTAYDALDLLTTSDNRIGLLLAEAQLLAQDVETAITSKDATQSANDSKTMTPDDQLRKMLTDVFVDNATLRKQLNSVIRCTLNIPEKSEKDQQEEEVPSRKTVLSKFL